MPSNDGPSKNGVRTIMGLTTVMPTPVPASSCLRPSEKASIAAFDAQYGAIPGRPMLAATEATLTMWPEPRASIDGRIAFVQWTIPM